MPTDMASRASKLYSLSFLVRKIQFEPAVADANITVNVSFLGYKEQTIFGPVALPSSGTLDVNSGNSFTLGLHRDMACELSDEFVMHVNLDRVDPDARLSEARIDVTKTFREVLKKYCSNNAKAQVS